MLTFKKFLEDATVASPTAGGMPGAATSTGGPNNALMQQSQNLANQISQMNAKLQKLIQQKAQVDKQVSSQASSANQNQAQSTQATTSALSAALAPGAPGAIQSTA